MYFEQTDKIFYFEIQLGWDQNKLNIQSLFQLPLT
jgi:hypothetical protein